MLIKMACFIFLLIISNTLHAKDKLSIAIIDFFPFGYINNQGHQTGMFIDIAKVISKEMNIDFDIRLLPVPRAIRDVSLGDVDLLISYKDPLMVKNVDFLGKVGCLTSMLIPSHSQNINSLDELNGLKVGYITGGYFDKRYAKQLKINPIEVPSNEAMLTMLIRGRLDAIVVNDAVFNAYLHGLNNRITLPKGWKNMIGKGFAVEVLETHLSISNESSFLNLKPKLRSAIKKLYVNGSFDDIYTKYKSGKDVRC